MARVQANYSKKTGELLNYKWIALLGRDEHNKQIQLTKRVEPEGLTPKAELKKMQRMADEWEAEEKQKHLASKETAEERRRKERDRENMTIDNFIDNYWLPKHVKNGRHTPDTIAFYDYMSADIKAYFKDEVEPDTKLKSIDKSTVLDYLMFLRTKARTKKGTPYGATTIQHHFSTLRNILELAVYLDYITENPCKKIRQNDRPQREAKEVDFLSEDEAVKFIDCLESQKEIDYWKSSEHTYLYWKTMFNLFITTGLRRGELVGLRWEDLNEDGKYFTIRRNITIDSTSDDKIHVGETKGKAIRKAPVSGYVLTLLLDLKTEQKEELGADVMPSAYIFRSLNDPYRPVYPTEPTRLMSKFVKRHGLRGLSVHDLRHSAASLAIQNGANVKQIQALLGHRDASTTLKFYTGITEQAQLATAESIDSVLRKKKPQEQKAE